LAPRVLIATGGTGGHVFPALACSQEFQKRGWEVWFVGTGRDMERPLLSVGQYRALQAKPLTGKGIVGGIMGILALVFALPQAVALLRSIKPDLVLGFGSYVSGPMIFGFGYTEDPPEQFTSRT